MNFRFADSTFLRWTILLAALALPPALQAAINWTLPTSVAGGQSYTISFYESPTIGTSPYTVRLYKNGAEVANGSGGLTYTTSDSASQSITFMAQGATGVTSTKFVNILAANQPPMGWFDFATSSTPVGSWLTLWGWSADNESGAPVARVDVLIDAVDRGDATLGGYRLDVANAFLRPDYTFSGWNASFDTTGLTLAVHTASIVTWDHFGNSSSLGSKNFTVTSIPGDSDGDGMPDSWETTYGLNPNSAADALLDPDGDGLTSLEEYLARRNPNEKTEGGKFPGSMSVLVKILIPTTQSFYVNPSSWIISQNP